ncbi:unnamed protein product [marine sediment metagenome]|uniref:Uncharacterized protein n=1 Tax=marine sediment metagenome TaxID=412755 RepID=X1FYS1_9ZZZZ
MNKKKCNRCNEIKLLSEFSFDKINRGYRSHCKRCRSNYQLQYRKNNKEKIREYNRKYDLKNKEKKLELQKIRYNNNINGIKDKKKKYRKKNIKECRDISRKHYYNNKEYYMKKKASREKNFGFVKLFDNFFPSSIGIIWHHVNNMIVIPVPKKIHTSNLGLDHREKMVIKIKKIYGLDVTRLLSI